MNRLEIAFDENQIEAETVFGCVGNRGGNFAQIPRRLEACWPPARAESPVGAYLPERYGPAFHFLVDT
jgi:hypothetical protein